MTIKERLQTLSEDDLRQKVVIPLLLSLGCNEAIDNCGPAENGKDVIYECHHMLKKPVYGAVVLKNDHNIKSADLDRGLTIQVDKALSKFTHRNDPRVETKVHEVILMTSFDITEPVRAFFRDQSGTTFPNIHFVDGDRFEFLIRSAIIDYTAKTGRDYVFEVETFSDVCNQLSGRISK